MISQANISPETPMGANLSAGGATFRVWAPRAGALEVALERDKPLYSLKRF